MAWLVAAEKAAATLSNSVGVCRCSGLLGDEAGPRPKARGRSSETDPAGTGHQAEPTVLSRENRFYLGD